MRSISAESASPTGSGIRWCSRSIRLSIRCRRRTVRTTLPGMPTTVMSGGTSSITTELAPTRTPWPMVIGPRIFAPAPISTPSCTVGCRLPGDQLVPPRVTP